MGVCVAMAVGDGQKATRRDVCHLVVNGGEATRCERGQWRGPPERGAFGGVGGQVPS